MNALSVTINVHDTPPVIYHSLPWPEEIADSGTRWKVLETPSVRLTFFGPKIPAFRRSAS